MKKLLVICGPTATGKTDLAISLAGEFGGEIVSADSRQIYKMMDIGTGKDISPNSKLRFRGSQPFGYYVIRGVKVWGYDLAESTQDFSVAHYLSRVDEIIKDIFSRGKNPILVGGTGLYIKSIVDGIDTAGIIKNTKLRQQFEGLDKHTLFEKLSQLDPIKAASLNISDKKNPRRLIRAIEIADFKIKDDIAYKQEMVDFDSVLFIGLTDTLPNLRERITARVEKRLKLGILDEIKKLLGSGVDWDYQAMSSLGYKQWRGYFEGKISKDDAINQWILGETQYAKRQLTWFKKDKRIIWYDISGANYLKDIENTVKKWYDQS